MKILEKISSGNRFNLFLGGIILAGAAFRFHDIGTESFTADELDTVYRIKQSPDLHRLLGFWVMHDGHPPLLHLLEYFWTKLFGFSEGAIRFPFALFGAGAILFAGRTAKEWFGTGAAIAVAAGVAFLQFPLMYSQLARPYAPGFFFSMMFVFYWNRFFFATEKKKWDVVWMAIAGIGAVYSHYFSLFLVAIIGGTGLFFLSKQNWKKYLIACGVIIIVFLPYVKIFLFQLTAGGVGGPGGWLGKPKPDFFYKHLWFIFDESRPVLFGSLILAAITFYMFRKRFGKYELLAIIFFAVPLLTGYFYSRIGNPVLQNSVLLFSFPFLLMLLFSRMPEIESGKWQALFPASFAVVTMLYVMSYKPFHLTDHFGRLHEIASATLDKINITGKDDVTCSFNVDYPYYMGYYWEKEGQTPQHVITYRNNADSLIGFRKAVEDSKGSLFVYGWSTTSSPPEILEIIRETYPYLIQRTYYFNSAVYVFARNAPFNYLSESNDELWRSSESFNNGITGGNPDWINNNVVRMDKQDSLNNIVDTVKHETSIMAMPSGYVQIDSVNKFGPTLKVKLRDIAKNPDNYAALDADIQLENSNSVGQLVIQVNRGDSLLYYMARATSSQLDSAGEFRHVYFAFQFPEDLQSTDDVTFYIYSFSGAPIRVRSLTARVMAGHTDIYGPRPDYE